MTIGVDLGGTNIRAGIREGDLIIKREQILLKDKDSLDSTLHQLIHLINPLVTGEVTGIGIAVPSIVDSVNGIVYDVVNIPSWKRVALKDILQKEFDLPVSIENDANCFALGELMHGKAKGFRHVVGITLGTGVGSGVIINGKIYSGNNGGAGEIGYLNYLDKDFEFYGGSFFFDEMHNTSAFDLSVKAKSGNAEAIRIWNEYGGHIGNLIKSVVYAFDPEAIVFGGSISNAFSLFESAMRKTISDHFHFPGSMSKLKIMQSENPNITLLGASSLVNQI
ncbi:MAG: ROK family protein [Cyclobacteriaceae bacterium]|nr:ROK family protein [Cyclobacteriaceae bacterium]